MCLIPENPVDQISGLSCRKPPRTWECGIKDEDVLKLAQERKYILVTYDQGFGDITGYRLHSRGGIIVIKAHDSKSLEQCHQVLEKLLKTETEFEDTLFIVDRYKYRKRKK